MKPKLRYYPRPIPMPVEYAEDEPDHFYPLEPWPLGVRLFLIAFVSIVAAVAVAFFTSTIERSTMNELNRQSAIVGSYQQSPADYNRNATAQASQPEILREWTWLMDEIQRVDKALTTLDQRLSAVLTPTDVAESPEPVPPSCGSSLGQDIRNATNQLKDKTRRLNGILSALAI